MFLWEIKKGTKYIRRYMYVLLGYTVLLIVLGTFKCTLKGTRCTLNNVGKHNFLSQKIKKYVNYACICIVCMSTSISTRAHTFPKVLLHQLHNRNHIIAKDNTCFASLTNGLNCLLAQDKIFACLQDRLGDTKRK